MEIKYLANFVEGDFTFTKLDSLTLEVLNEYEACHYLPWYEGGNDTMLYYNKGLTEDQIKVLHTKFKEILHPTVN